SRNTPVQASDLQIEYRYYLTLLGQRQLLVRTTRPAKTHGELYKLVTTDPDNVYRLHRSVSPTDRLFELCTSGDPIHIQIVPLESFQAWFKQEIKRRFQECQCLRVVTPKKAS